ncbi:chaplin [Streptomyces sp. NPDC047880]|uniref:chaplin n=1 Tax=Streptomyces sp. NPDC047880 TaxID=3155626 RepID=UPI0034550A74
MRSGSTTRPAFRSHCDGAAIGSPGVLSGNLLEVPVDVPVSVCGKTVDVDALLNPAFGKTRVNEG